MKDIAETTRIIDSRGFFIAHDGAVFGLSILFQSDERSSGQNNQLLIASCSDDRTIKLWNATYALEDTEDFSNADGGLPASKTDTDSPKFPLIAKAWAHSSRVWHVDLLLLNDSHSETSELYLASAGEDAHCHLWRASPNEPTITFQRTLSKHSGKNIWSIVNRKNVDGSIAFASGGADGNVFARRIFASSLQRHNILDRGFSVSDMMSSFAPGILEPSEQPRSLTAGKTPPKKDRPDVFRSYDFVDSDSLLITTQSGRVILMDISRNASRAQKVTHQPTCRYIGNFPSLQAHSAVVGLASLGLAVFAGSHGNVFCYSKAPDTLKSLFTFEGTVRSLLAQEIPVNNHFLAGSQEPKYFVVFLDILEIPHHFNIYKVMTSCEPQLVNSFDFCPDAPQPVTSMLVTRYCDVLYISLGHRDGTIALYILDCDLFKRPCTGVANCFGNSSLAPYHKDAITQQIWLPKQMSQRPTGKGYFFTTSRDSTYAVHAYDLDDYETDHIPLHRGIPPFGPNIEGAYLHPQSGDLILYGFRSMDFIVYNGTQGIEIASLAAGGTHRVWKYLPNTDPDSEYEGTFVWTRAANLNYAFLENSGLQRVKQGGHGREIKTCAVRPCTSLNTSRERIIATGAEDTDIRLFMYSPSNGDEEFSQLRCVRVIRKHNTGLQQLEWSNDGRYLFSCGGNEEFFVWKIEEAPLVGLGVVCVGTFNLISEVGDLRITAFNVRRLEDEDNSIDDDNVEVESSDEDRSDANTIKQSHNNDIHFVISMSFSNSTVKVR